MSEAGELNDVSDRKFTTEFIKTYRSLPSLWNKKNEEYGNKYKKNMAYDILLQKYREKYPNAEKTHVTRKINTLRTNFRREMKRLDALNKNDCELHKPTLWYFDLFSFVKDNNTMMQEDEEQTEEEDEPIRKKLKPDGDVRNKTQDDFKKIVEVWATKLRQMSSSQQLYAEKFINDIIFEGTLGTLTRNSVQINVQPVASSRAVKCQSQSPAQHAPRRDSVDSFASKISPGVLITKTEENDFVTED